MKQIVNQESINTLSKNKKIIYLIIILSFIITASIMVLIFLFTNRKIRYVMAVILAIIATIEASGVLYLVYTSLIPLHHYEKFMKNSMRADKYLTHGLVLKINEKVKHVRGLSVKEIKIKDLQEDKEYVFYIENNVDISDIKENQQYQFITYQSIITAYENI